MRDLDTFKKHTKYKLIVMYLSILVPVILVTLLEAFLSEHLAIDMVIFRYVFFTLIVAAIVFKIVRYHRILLSNDYAQRCITNLNDERNLFIGMKTLNLSFKIVVFVTAILTLVGSFVSEVMFYVLLGELGIMLVSYLGTKIYFTKKY